MKKKLLFTALFLPFILLSQTATVLVANGPGNTYEEINSVLAPGVGGDAAIEAPGITIDNPTYPDCSNHDNFDNGEATNSNRHINEVYDDILEKYVFKFHIHVNEDIDRDKCETTDRQRNEIKSYASSPDYLKGILGETFEYKWKFKLDDGFQGSSNFTHIHQLKSVGGISAEESLPMITLTAYSSSLVLRYSATQGDQATVSGTSIPLSDLMDNWIEVTETITYGYENEGSYEIEVTNFETGTELMSYSNNTLRWYKTDADFIRPKWGIYRSLNNAAVLRDEEVLYADFSITEWTEDETLSNESFEILKNLNIHPNPATEVINFPFSNNNVENHIVEITNTLGAVVHVVKLSSNNLSIADLSTGLYFLKIINIKTNASVVKKLIKL